ncbi:5172_t:CDS:10 [Diversispora eburnea]|uniref:5172_t:CDS:1 n=1 Tax=Diversispora eburnea TaxID=1213867 RepID=A0A9N9A2R0_9GLOM|nr:5172_t:CDS:10 [Diversispora eburnea]
MITTTNITQASTTLSPVNSRSFQTPCSFNEISRKVLRANYPSPARSNNNSSIGSINTNNNGPDIDQILEVLISTNLNTSNTFDHDLLELLVSGCHAINPGEEHVASKFSRIVFTFCSKRMVNLNGNINGNKTPLELLINFLLNAFTNATQNLYTVDILRALIRRMAINCLGNICSRSGTKLQGKYKNIYEVLLGNLSTQVINNDDSAFLKVISSTLRSLQLVINEDKNVLAEPFGPTIETIKKCVFFNIEELKESARNSDQTRTRNNMRKNSNPTSPNRNMHVRTRSLGRKWTSSDSEISDEDSRIRQNALGCLQSIAKVSLSTSPSLFTLITYETIPAIRITACSVIMTMFDNSKQYLALADDREIKSSFTSLSAKLGAIVRELHADVNVRIITMTLISNIVECKSCVEEVDNILRVPIINDGGSSHSKISKYGKNLEVVNLLTFLVKIISSVDQPPSIRIESWGVLCACARTHFVLISPMWLQINPLIELDLKVEDVNIRTAAMNFLVEYARELAAVCGSRQNDSEEDGIIQQFQNIVMPEVFQWWTAVLSNHIQLTSVDKCHAVRALSCDFISCIPANIFSSLPSEKKNFCIKILLGFAKDESQNVRAAACRGLGVYILFPELQQDTKFASDMAFTAIQQMSDSNLLVRVRSSWALGNLCDTMVILSNPENNNVRNTNLNEFLINVMWVKIVKAGLSASNDNDKVRPNGVRTLGTANMLRNPNIPIGLKTNSWSTLLYESLIRVVQTSKNFKVRINACLALATPMTRVKYGDITILCKILHAIVSSIENVDNLSNTGFCEVKYQDQLRTQRFIEPFIERVNQWSANRNGHSSVMKRQ